MAGGQLAENALILPLLQSLYVARSPPAAHAAGCFLQAARPSQRCLAALLGHLQVNTFGCAVCAVRTCIRDHQHAPAL